MNDKWICENEWSYEYLVLKAKEADTETKTDGPPR